MIKRMCLIAALLITTWTYAGEPDKELHEKCLYPTVMIFSGHYKVPKSGTGIIVKSVKQGETYNNMVFTCAHILEKAPPLYEYKYEDPDNPNLVTTSTLIKKPEYLYYARYGIYKDWSKLVAVENVRCKIELIDRDQDIAILTFKTIEEMPVADLDFKPRIYIGNEVFKIGCGVGSPYRLDYGKVTSIPDSIGNAIEDAYRISAFTISGDSGGPMFHENKLVGIVLAMRTISYLTNKNLPINEMVYVRPISAFLEKEDFKKFIKEFGKKKSETKAESVPKILQPSN